MHITASPNKAEKNLAGCFVQDYLLIVKAPTRDGIPEPLSFASRDLDEVFSTWMTFGGNTRDLGSIVEEIDEITNIHQILEEVLLTEHGDGIASIKRCRRDLFSDGVWNLEMASGRG
ncbi:hypothetical protein Tco_0757340 [Tanacetum coccineum]